MLIYYLSLCIHNIQVEDRRAKATKDQVDKWAWQKKQYKKGEDRECDQIYLLCSAIYNIILTKYDIYHVQQLMNGVKDAKVDKYLI